MNRPPLSNNTIDSVQQREVGRAKDLSAPPRITPRWILLGMENILGKRCRDNNNTHFMFNNRTVYVTMWKNMVQPDRSHRQYGACVLHAGYERLQIHTRIM